MVELTPEAIERGYNARAAVPDHPQWFARYAELSAAAVARWAPQLDLRYGPGPKQTLDLFVPAAPARGTFVYIHGGYWRALDKRDFAFVAGPFVAAGIAVASVNYDLCPDVSIATIVEECERAIAWVVREGPAYGVPAAPLVVGGHSAGGHLASMMLTADWAAAGLTGDPLAAAVSLSGVHDLAPMVGFSYNVDLRLDAAEAARLSPVNRRPRSRVPLLIAVGGDETSEFLRQAQLLWDAWPESRPAASGGPLVVAGRNHFSVVAEYADPASAVTQATLALF